MNCKSEKIDISVILPIYNGAKYVKKAIDSVLKQTYHNFELVIVDDGSVDDSYNVCKEYKDDRIKTIKLEHKGVSYARNIGLCNAVGKYIKFLDSDDELEIDALRTLIDNVDDCDVAFSGFVDTTSSNRYIPSLTIKKFENYNSFINDILNFDFYYNITSISSIFIKKEKIKFYFDGNVEYGEDALFNIQNLKKCSRIILLPHILYKYNKGINNNCLTHVFCKNRLYTSYKIFCEFFNSTGNDEVRKYFIDKFIIRIHNFFISLVSCQYFLEKDKKEIIKEYLNNIINNNQYIIKNGSPMRELENFYKFILNGNVDNLYLYAINATPIFSKSSKLVSVIMPVYNMEDTVAKSIESVINQKYTKWELIIVDDGSTDKSSKICDEYSNNDFRIKVVHTKNNGLSAAKNVGLKFAKGEYVSFIDADDRYDERTLDVAIKYSIDADVVVFLFESSPIDILKSKSLVNVHFDIIPNNEKDIDILFFYYTMDFSCNKLYRRSIIKYKHDEDVDYAEDSIFNLQNLKNVSGINLVNEVLYYYTYCGVKLRKNAIRSLIKRLKVAFDLYSDNEFLLRKIYVSTVRAIRENILLIIDNKKYSVDEKKQMLVNAKLLVNSLGNYYDREDFLYEKNKNWWHQIKNGQFEDAIKELRELYIQRGRKIV